MRRRARLLPLWAAVVACGHFESRAPFSPTAAPSPSSNSRNLLLTNAQVWTSSGWAQALAVEDGIIVAVGANADAAAAAPQGAPVFDLQGKTVLPGLHDMHVHGLFAGLEQFACSFAADASPAVIQQTVAACAEARRTGEWIVGGNWVAATFAPGQQNRQFLDAVAPDHPVLLNDAAHHSVWLNSKALALAGITRDTPDPEGGRIERDADGAPTGLLRESAAALAERVVPTPSVEHRRKALTLSTSQMLAYGITSFIDASLRHRNIGIYSALSEAGVIKQRVRGCVVWEPTLEDDPPGSYSVSEHLIENRARYHRPRFAPDCVKMFLDGVPTESRTGAMVEPYAGLPADTPHSRGMLLIPQPQLNEAVARFDRSGLQIKFHCAGDGAARAALDAVEHARRVNGWAGPRHHVGHSTFVTAEDIPRAGPLNVAWEFSPYIWYPTPIAMVDVGRAVGSERMRRFVPIRDALDTKALVVTGSDWSVVPSVNPWLALETLVTRQMPGGSEQTLAEGQRISREQALRVMTAGGAALMGHRDEVGAIEVGLRADLVVTATNPLRSPIQRVHQTKVVMTFIDGELVYRHDEG